MSLLQHQWINKGKPISIQHARTPLGEKVITCQGLKRHVKYKVDGYFEYQGRKYVCEYNIIIIIIIIIYFSTLLDGTVHVLSLHAC